MPSPFAEPTPDLWYTGGQTYYEAFGDEPGPNDNFLVVTGVVPGHAGGPVAQNPSILEAIRAFVVGGAYRLALQPDWSLEVPARFPSAHTMLVQTSASQRDHKAWLDGLVSLFGGTAARGATDYGWSSGQVANEVASNEQAWRRWYDEMVTSRTRVLEERPRVGAGGIVTWDQVKALIPAFIEVLRIKVVNSDEDVAAELDFAPRIGVGGTMGRPQDLFVIVIGGTKLSRGLTLDGLSVTYFTRWNPSPTEDTVLQLCRWYGYRGRHLEFCRLFTTEGIFDQLTGMEENDRALRQDLARLMREGRSPADAALVIAANPKALPTGKLGEGQVHDLAFSPFTAIFRHVESSDDSLQARNQDTAIRLVGNIRAHAARRVVAASGAVRGFCSPNWTALEVAGILDGFQYADHNPTSQGNPAREHFRVPDGTRRIVTGRTLLDDPYQVAAYLRQWAAEGNPPVFNVGVAFGEMTADVMPFDFPLVNREIRPNGEVIGGWTGRRSGWRGDQLFDGPAEAELVPGTAERRPNARGLVLMYVIHKDAVGRHGRGSSRPSHTPFLGIVIPEGGPIWRRVTVDRRRIVTA